MDPKVDADMKTVPRASAHDAYKNPLMLIILFILLLLTLQQIRVQLLMYACP